MADGPAAWDGVVYRFEGPATAPPLVLLGSLGTTMSVWDAQMPILRPWFRVLRVEHPGHGGSEVPAGLGSLEAMGARLLGALDHLGIDRANFAGVSLGGQLCMWVAENHPGRVGRLAVSASTARFNNPEAYRERANLVRTQGMGQLVGGTLSRWFTEPFAKDHPEVIAKYASMLSEVRADGYAYCAEAVADADLRPYLARIEAPTLIFVGALDPVVTPELAVSLATAIRGSMLCVLPDAAHLANVEQAGHFNEILLGHLAGSQAERGLEVRKAVLGAEYVERVLANSSELTSDFQDLLTRWPWGDIWARPGLDRRTRRLLTIALLVALNRPEELEMHVRQAMNEGLSEADLKEVLLHTAIYAGVPAANAAFIVADRVACQYSGPAL